MTTDDEKLLENEPGNHAYVAPEHNLYLDLRIAKIKLLKQEKILKQLNVTLLEPSIEKATQERDNFQRQVEFEISRIKAKFPVKCQEAISMIEKVTDETDLLPPTHSTTQSFKFLSDQKDDVWGLSKWMVQLLEQRINFGHQSDNEVKFLNKVMALFKKNRDTCRNLRQNSNEIVRDLDLFILEDFSTSTELITRISKLKQQEIDLQKKSQPLQTGAGSTTSTLFYKSYQSLENSLLSTIMITYDIEQKGQQVLVKLDNLTLAKKPIIADIFRQWCKKEKFPKATAYIDKQGLLVIEGIDKSVLVERFNQIRKISHTIVRAKM